MNWLRSIFLGGYLAALGTLAHAQVPQSPVASGSAQSEFVTRQGTHFYLRDKPYYFAGTNLWYGTYLGAPAPIGNRERLGKELDALKALGVTNLRVLAMSEASELKRAVRPAIMTKPGEFDEALLTGLDYLLAEMAKRHEGRAVPQQLLAVVRRHGAVRFMALGQATHSWATRRRNRRACTRYSIQTLQPSPSCVHTQGR